jgi:hypothetical protein
VLLLFLVISFGFGLWCDAIRCTAISQEEELKTVQVRQLRLLIMHTCVVLLLLLLLLPLISHHHALQKVSLATAVSLLNG